MDGDVEEITGSELPPTQEIVDLLEGMLSEEDLNDLLAGGGGLLDGELGDLLGDGLCNTIPIVC